MPETTVAAIITNRDSSTSAVLLTLRKVEPFNGQWCLPGGHINQYEHVRDAILREVKEETDLDFDARFIGYFDEIIPERGIHAVVIVFTGFGVGRISAQEDEVADIRWFSIGEARSFTLAFKHNSILDAYNAQADTSGIGYSPI